MKRFFDFVFSLICLVILSLPLLFICLLVWVAFGWPIIFRQSRPGLHGKLFILFKFRTMTNACGSDGILLPDHQRLTMFGRFLRSTSLDELPELWNVLRGDMSFVGPRPLLPNYLSLYSPNQARRHNVRPGITGLAQIMGRNSISWEKRLHLDVWYVKHHSLLLDLRILLITFVKVFLRDGISASAEVAMPPFSGSSPSRGNC